MRKSGTFGLRRSFPVVFRTAHSRTAPAAAANPNANARPCGKGLCEGLVSLPFGPVKLAQKGVSHFETRLTFCQ